MVKTIAISDTTFVDVEKIDDNLVKCKIVMFSLVADIVFTYKDKRTTYKKLAKRVFENWEKDL